MSIVAVEDAIIIVAVEHPIIIAVEHPIIVTVEHPIIVAVEHVFIEDAKSAGYDEMDLNAVSIQCYFNFIDVYNLLLCTTCWSE